MIPISELQIGGVYLVSARNFYIAAWTGRGFWGVAASMGEKGEDCFYLQMETHWHDGDGKSGTVKPKELIGELPQEVLNDTGLLEHLQNLKKTRREQGLPVTTAFDMKEE